MTARFKIGDRVVVRVASPPGHVRTPSYLRGKRGVILRDFGAWKNPELLAYGRPGLPKETNYWVQFTMDEVWGGEGRYSANDTLVAEIYGLWLAPAAASAKGDRR